MKLLLCIAASIVVYLWDKIPQWKRDRYLREFKKVKRWHEYASAIIYLTPNDHPAPILTYDRSWEDKGYIDVIYKDGYKVIITPFGELDTAPQERKL